MGAPLCQECRKRKARYIRPRGKKLSANKEHSLCRQCWTAEMDRQRQLGLPDRLDYDDE